MLNLHRCVISLGLPLIIACGGAGDGPSGAPETTGATAVASPLSSAPVEPALTREATEKALAGIAPNGTDCLDMALSEAPIRVAHLDVNGNEEPNIQETGSQAKVVFYGATADDRVTEATVVATVVGQTPTGGLYGNHNALFLDGTIRSLRDVVSLSPTSDPCVFDANVQMNFYDGSREYAGRSGAGVATGQLNFCGAPGHITIYGRLCKA
jgi:hypothetical protein